jgi:hypothetical protein
MAAPSPSIETAAQSFIQSYATAMHLAQSQPPTPLPTIASTLASHYLPGFTSFTLGQISPMPNHAFASSLIKGHIERMVKVGVGCDIRLKMSRVQVVNGGSGSSALCFITWEIFPSEVWKGAGWEWDNCYFYRRKMDGSEGWEGVISDAEIEGLLENIPEFFG